MLQAKIVLCCSSCKVQSRRIYSVNFNLQKQTSHSRLEGPLPLGPGVSLPRKHPCKRVLSSSMNCSNRIISWKSRIRTLACAAAGFELLPEFLWKCWYQMLLTVLHSGSVRTAKIKQCAGCTVFFLKWLEFIWTAHTIAWLASTRHGDNKAGAVLRGLRPLRRRVHLHVHTSAGQQLLGEWPQHTTAAAAATAKREQHVSHFVSSINAHQMTFLSSLTPTASGSGLINTVFPIAPTFSRLFPPQKLFFFCNNWIYLSSFLSGCTSSTLSEVMAAGEAVGRLERHFPSFVFLMSGFLLITVPLCVIIQRGLSF